VWKFNPFKPNALVYPNMFAGRGDELAVINRALLQAKHGNPTHFLLHGERGIGKSSLLLYARILASGEATAWYNQPPHKFLTVDVMLDPAATYIDIISKIGREFSRKAQECSRIKTAAKGIWEFLSKWEVMGTRFHSGDNRPMEMIEDLVNDFCTTLTNLKPDVDGALVLIDEADKPAASANLGQFLKLFTEGLTRRGCEQVLLGLSGISTVIDKLKESHESSPRIMQHILLEPLLVEERKVVVEKGLEQAEKQGEKVSITPDALEWIARSSEGYPHFIQQYASSAYDTDTDRSIALGDVTQAAYKENGALDQLGVNYFEDMYLDQIDSDEYRLVLRAMADHGAEYMSRQDIKSATKLKETTLTNALRALRDRRIIIPHPEKRGFYKLPTNSFGAWIRVRSHRQQTKGDDGRCGPE
jgi:hypothetical protein